MDQLFREVEATEGYRLVVDLQDQSVTTPGGERFQFDIDAFRKHSLLNGLDEIGLTLQQLGQDQSVRGEASGRAAMVVCMIRVDAVGGRRVRGKVA